MAYQLAPNGLPMVNGLASPLTPEQLQAAGVAPPAQPGIPVPDLRNPYGGLPPNAVAGPGGAPPDLGAADPAIRMAAGDGRGPILSPSDIARLQAPPGAPTSNAHVAPVSRADGLLSAGGGSPQGTQQPPHLLSTAAPAQPSQGPAPDPGQDAAAAWAFQHAKGAGAGPRRLAETGATEKYTQYAPIPEALASDITARQESLDKARAGVDEETARLNSEGLQNQRSLIDQQLRDAQAAEQRRQLVDQRIQSLQAKSDADESALASASPKQATDFFGGSHGAQIISAIAVALGARAQVYTGHNVAQEQLNDSINRWVNDQRQQYDAAKNKALISNNAYKDALQTFGTPEAAEAQVRLQAMSAKTALMGNMADQSKNQLWLQNAQLAQQQDQLQRQQLRAQSIQQAGMKEVEARLQATGGAGTGTNPYLAAAKASAEYRGAVRAASDTTNEDIKTELEGDKVRATAGGVATAASAAADSAQRLREKASSIGDRAAGAGRGELDAALEDAKGKYAAYLVKSGQASARNARTAADEFYNSRVGAVRGPAADVALGAHIKQLRANAIRAHGANAAGLDAPADSGELGEPE